MTAEIVIMNKNAVVMAADSIVTTIKDEWQKTYASANKLFAVSYNHSIGVMTYGIAGFINLPWETIIKSYRKERADKNTFDTVKSCVNDFIDYLESSDIFKKEDKEQFSIEIYKQFHLGIVNDISKHIENLISENSEFNDYVEASKFIIGKILELLETFPKPKQHDFENYISYVSQNMEKIVEIEEIIYGKVYTSLIQDIEKLRQSYYNCILLPLSSGIVFSGFGKNEYLPTTYSLNITEFRDSKLVYSINDDDKYKGNCFIPFAQRSAIDLFMTERSPRLMDTITDYLNNEVPENAEQIIKKIDDVVQSYCSKKLEVLESFPVNELAFVAENLVNLSSFQMRLSRELETVGGPIDVAVITKGDGFIWVRRKHYFKPELNPHFFEKQ